MSKSSSNQVYKKIDLKTMLSVFVGMLSILIVIFAVLLTNLKIQDKSNNISSKPAQAMDKNIDKCEKIQTRNQCLVNQGCYWNKVSGLPGECLSK